MIEAMKFFPSLVLALLLLPLKSQAFTAAIVGAVTNSTPSANSGSNYEGKIGLGYGALIEGSLAPGVGLEIDVLSLKRKYENLAPPAVTTTQDLTEIPLLVRLHMGPFLSVGFGAYYARYTGKIHKGTQEIDYANSSFSKDDFGAATSIGIYFPLLPGLKLLIDGRYTLGVTDNDTSSAELKFNDVLLLAGLRLGF